MPRPIDRRLEKLEQHFRCPRHRTPLVCRCEMPAHPWTPTETEEFGQILSQIITRSSLRFEMLAPGPPCPRCQRIRYCVECQPDGLRLADVLATLSPQDQTRLVELLEKCTHARP